jgi:hypothetical protein
MASALISFSVSLEVRVTTSTTSFTRCGFIFTPSLAMTLVARASCSMVKLL